MFNLLFNPFINVYLSQEIYYISQAIKLNRTTKLNSAINDTIIDCVRVDNTFIAERAQRKLINGAKWKGEHFINP